MNRTLVIAITFALAALLQACQTSGQVDRTFACGVERCAIASQYCQRMHGGAAPPEGHSNIHESCIALPTPDCSQMGPYQCAGDAKTGITVSVFAP
jgi:hypothetical protein